MSENGLAPRLRLGLATTLPPLELGRRVNGEAEAGGSSSELRRTERSVARLAEDGL